MGGYEALVTGAFSRRMKLRLDAQPDVTARIKGKKIQPVCGDRVQAEPIANEPEWLITNILPRTNELTRPDSRGRTEVLAANIDCLVVVASVAPPPDWFVVDRYLAAAELMRVPALIVFNKIDLSDSEATSPGELAEYQAAGFETLCCSAEDGTNLDRLAEYLENRIAIIVGQSGVGKSSLINYLIGDADQRTATLSASTGEGRHTTVNSVMLDLPNGGAVIDSPGVRDYAPAIEEPDDVIRGFREISEHGQHCRFANCRHLREPDCAVKAGVEDGSIHARRYESFKRLMSLANKLADQKF